MLSAVYKLEFLEKYEGLLSCGEISRELHTTVDELKAIKREFGSKCWSCRNACNGNNCSWVKSGIYPDYVDIDERGLIVGCRNYEFDAFKCNIAY